jgi:proteasome lid subunit RPN8/RPN11
VNTIVTIHLGPAVVERIREHGAAAYPDECCGALIGSDRGDLVDVAVVKPLANVTDEGPRRRFRVSAEDYRLSEDYASRAGANLLGFYHSHPDHPAEPSQYDLDHAWPNFSYVIVSVREGRPADLRSWRLEPDRSAFAEETVAAELPVNQG